MIPLLTLLFAAEITARCVVTATGGSNRFQQIEQIIVFLGNEPGQSIFEPDADCFWRLKPNVVLPSERGPAWSGVMSNSHGLHSREVSVAAVQDRLRVLCFGDSSTFAFGVEMTDAWPNQLQTVLDQEQPQTVEVLNAGIPGQTTYQGRQRLMRELTKWHPHLAFITFGNNDGWRWDGLTDREQAQRASAARGPSLANYSRAWQWLVSVRDQLAVRQSTQGQLAWARQATWNYFDPNETWTPRVSLPDFRENLRVMVETCRENECEPILIVWPDQRQLVGQPTWRPPYQQAMRQVAEETNVRCLDLVPLFERAGDWAVERFIPNDVVHVDPLGNRFVCDAVARVVREAMISRQVANFGVDAP